MLPPSSPSPGPVLPLRLLEACYDGAVPDELTAVADAGSYERYIYLLARAAERRFHRRILNTLQSLSTWRMRISPYRWHRLDLHSKSLQSDRQRAREAFDLLG